MRRRLVLAAALVGVAAPALALSTIRGIPGQCTMETWRVQPGKPPVSVLQIEMVGAWAQRAFHLSHDGKTLVAHTFGGIGVYKDGAPPKEYKVQIMWRNLFISPDNHRIAFWVKEGLAVADLDAAGEPGGPLKYEVIYKPAKDKRTGGAAWSPTGTELFLLEHYQEEVQGKKATGTSLVRVGLSGGMQVATTHETLATWFMLPQTHEYGSGPVTEAFHVLLGGKDGLWFLRPDGSEKQKIREFGVEGVHDIVFSPDLKKPKAAIRLAKDQPQKDQVYKGVYLIHLDQLKKGEPVPMDQLHSVSDTHTFWFSPTGKHILWASDSTVAYRAVDAKEPVKIDVAGTIKGAHWSRDEKRIAVCADNKLYVHELASKKTTEIAKFDATFVADPVWKGGEDEIVVTSFKDSKAPK